MAETSAKAREERFVHLVARAGLATSIAGAVILTVVLLGNLYIIPFKHTPASWLRLFVIFGPVLSSLLGFVSTGSTWYGRWRIVRRKERYDVRDDALDQALNLPDELQNLPNQLGCLSRLGPTVLAASLIVCLFTFMPGPLGFIGNGINGANIAVNDTSTSTTATTTAVATPKPTAKPGNHHPTATPIPVQPTATSAPPTATPIPPTPTTAPTATPTPTPHVDVRLSPTNPNDTCYSSGGAYDVKFTLDNTRSNIAVGWQLILTPTTAPNFTNPWASGKPSEGSVPAGKQTTITLSITGSNCPYASYAGTQLDGEVALTSGSSATLPFTLTLYHEPVP